MLEDFARHAFNPINVGWIPDTDEATKRLLDSLVGFVMGVIFDCAELICHVSTEFLFGRGECKTIRFCLNTKRDRYMRSVAFTPFF